MQAAVLSPAGARPPIRAALTGRDDALRYDVLPSPNPPMTIMLLLKDLSC